MRALVTGASGFAGQWLCSELLDRGWSVAGTMLGDVVPTSTLSLEKRRSIRWVSCDVRRRPDVARTLDESRPDAIFHLAGVASQGMASANPGLALEVNVAGAGNVLAEADARRLAGTCDPTVLVVGSGEQYGRHDESEMPLVESAELRPLTVYAASKAAQELVALAQHRSGGLKVIAVRSFNHSGQGQSDAYVLPALVKRALALRNSWKQELIVGNATPVRDFTHVSDVVRAYVMLVERGRAGEVYNVSSGCGVDVATLAHRVLALVGTDARLQSDPALARPVDVPALVGDPTKLRLATGWTPQHDLDFIITDLIHAASD
ncbi:MAG: NAD-dependent epimerase/dehydratase family protein [Gemmatimonadaceae bacterium]